MKIQKITYLILLLLFPALLFSQQAGSDAIFKKILKEYTLNADGSVKQRIVKECSLLTYNAFHRYYGETFILYNPLCQKLKINSCYTLMADGKRVNSPSNAFNEVLPRSAANAPVFNYLREMVVTHTGLEIGATIFLDYEIISTKDYFPYLMGEEVFAEMNPVDEFKVIISVPKEKPFNFRLYNSTVEAGVTITDKQKIYNWTLTKLMAHLPESFVPEESRYLPVLRFTSFKDMQEAGNYLCSQNAFEFELTDDIRDAALKANEGIKDDLSRVLKIQDMVVNNFKLFPVPMYLTAYKLRAPQVVFKDAGGTELEKACLMVTMLKAINIEAIIAGVQDAYYDKGIGEFSSFSQYIVQVTVPGLKDIYLGLTHNDEQDQAYKLGGKVLVFLNKGKEIVSKTMKPEESGIELKGKLILDKEGKLSGELEMNIEGTYNPYFDLKSDKIKALKLLKANHLETELSGDPEIKEGESLIKFRILPGEKVKQSGNYWFIEIPSVSNGLSSKSFGELTIERRNPVDINYPVSEESEIKIDLPSGFKWVGKEINENIKNSAGNLSIKVRQNGLQLIIGREIEIKTSMMSMEYYKDLRELTALWYSKTGREVIISNQ